MKLGGKPFQPRLPNLGEKVGWEKRGLRVGVAVARALEYEWGGCEVLGCAVHRVRVWWEGERKRGAMCSRAYPKTGSLCDYSLQGTCSAEEEKACYIPLLHARRLR